VAVNEFPTNHPENVYPDIGGWISGACLSAEPVAAGDLTPGDIVLLDDNTPAEVTDVKFGDFSLVRITAPAPAGDAPV
jgi:hypothetical protein